MEATGSSCLPRIWAACCATFDCRLALVWCVASIGATLCTARSVTRALQVKNIGAGRLELNYCIPVLQQKRFGDQLHAGLQIGIGTEFL